eukprot:CAMPEP_0176365048 /NCGR_PEP_ID=MMETSP0126-20121128/20199_1 /TAXON_ID=141414 ORGANISM="Strombidinopsis acuminatum, Strain SPMC142" /NCGR_SAMPLE_ID=MMETSP0126 /ASSEMBLY_ACC=CAM_ASM_000229 /LENGTH=143 /DNA_ID=CAMNT_0017721897 /DNA_START=14 /DNA_END=445 /DNA_ORIENTATION=-
MALQDYHKYDTEFLVQQYESINAMYDNPELLGESHVATMRRAFQSYDKDGNGVLDKYEVQDLLTNHFKESGRTKKPKQADIEEFFAQLDDDHSQEIDFEEFKLFLVFNMKKRLLEPLHDYFSECGLNLEPLIIKKGEEEKDLI